MYFSVALLEMTLKAKNMDSNRLDHQTKSISGHSFFFYLTLLPLGQGNLQLVLSSS